VLGTTLAISLKIIPDVLSDMHLARYEVKLMLCVWHIFVKPVPVVSELWHLLFYLYTKFVSLDFHILQIV